MNEEEVTVEIRDSRGGFCYQESAATRALRSAYEGPQRRTALAIYQTLTDLANEYRQASGSNSVIQMSRGIIADWAGVTAQTVDDYLIGFCELGLLRKEVGSDDRGGSAVNRLLLLSPPEGGRSENAGGALPERRGGVQRASDSRLQKVRTEKEPPTPLPNEQQRRSATPLTKQAQAYPGGHVPEQVRRRTKNSTTQRTSRTPTPTPPVPHAPPPPRLSKQEERQARMRAMLEDWVTDG